MQFKTLAIIAAVGQASASFDLISNTKVAENIFGGNIQKVRVVDRAVHDAASPIIQATARVVRDMQPSMLEGMTFFHATLDKVVDSVHRVMTPEMRAKVRNSIINVVKTTNDNFL
ncbi:hypothetical protein BX661DRAFT_184427 [Kickxella alabastrina]|uniref:uncharacterized protein n=1 Tax=Kickxella alabastrina TaxID=61397 RepID=UPI00221EA2B2|nr:uncharacterized protein BX661DRAFT_184427 [Kickxella alabastrina]KAI7825939.1 hypothetical protein BX661DRAFT_184427 [Kickxella alabastrina]KAJ1947171.1 hypothetical protein GGF37_000626 [Kickxella alabastrina]